MNETFINILETNPIHIFESNVASESTQAIRYFIITFELLLLSTLNHAKLPNITLFSFSLNQFQSEVKLSISDDFNFETLKYDSKILLDYQKEHVVSAYSYIDKYKYKQTKSQQIILKYLLKSNKILEKGVSSKIKFQFGSKAKKNNQLMFQGKFSISNFKYELQDLKNLRSQSTALSQFPSQQIEDICNYDHEEGSYPVVYQLTKKNLKSYSLQYFYQLIQNVQPYESQSFNLKKNHLFICHDMKGGYAEDTMFSNPVQKNRRNSYRFNYFWQTSIFNYFSHKTISIPPKHWRELCKKYKVKCLGTFIVEPNKIEQNFYIQDQFALKLVYLAKKYKFDGYLINIQDVVRDIEHLKKWLTLLTTEIHKQIPGSIISWYDSITKEGQIEYQNELNEKNMIFYDLTDSFFTNYWWTNKQLNDSIANGKSNKTIFIGNDVWGRGTFGGGQFNLFKAIDQIQKINYPNFGAAIFGPGYTYQKGGQNNNPFLKSNQDKLYRGVQFDQYNITLKDWVEVKGDLIKDFGLNQQKEWYGRMYPMNLWPYKLKQRSKFTLIFEVNQTRVTQVLIKNQNNKTQSPFNQVLHFNYKIVLKIRDTLNQETQQYGQKSQYQVNIDQKFTKKISIQIQGQKISPKSDIQIFEFSTLSGILHKQKLIVSYYLKQNDWIQQVPISKISINQLYNTYYNIGHGSYFHYKGFPILKQYDYMSDYDIPQTLAINHPFATDLQYDDAYIGGSALIVQDQIIDLIILDLPSNQYGYPLQYYAKIVSKNINGVGSPTKKNSNLDNNKSNEQQINREYDININNNSSGNHQTIRNLQNTFSSNSAYSSSQLQSSILEVSLRQSNGFSILLDKSSEIPLTNGWIQSIYFINRQNYKKMKRMFYKQFQTKLSIKISKKILIGQLQLQPLYSRFIEESIVKSDIQLIITQSFKTNNNNQMYINLQIIQYAVNGHKSYQYKTEQKNGQQLKQSSSQPKQKQQKFQMSSLLIPSTKSTRYLISIKNKFSCFIYLTKQNKQQGISKGHISQIRLEFNSQQETKEAKRQESIDIQLMNVDASLRSISSLRHQNVNVKQLKTQQLGHKIIFRNF